LTLSVYDAAGRTVFTRSLGRSTAGALPLTGLPAGVYLVKLSSPGLTQAQKLVLQR
jgi:hypothetical protein